MNITFQLKFESSLNSSLMLKQFESLTLLYFKNIHVALEAHQRFLGISPQHHIALLSTGNMQEVTYSNILQGNSAITSKEQCPISVYI